MYTRDSVVELSPKNIIQCSIVSAQQIRNSDEKRKKERNRERDIVPYYIFIYMYLPLMCTQSINKFPRGKSKFPHVTMYSTSVSVCTLIS